MSLVLAKNWWSLVVRGLAAIALGLIMVIRPGLSLRALVLVFGTYALVDGLMGLAGAVRAAETHERWGSLVVEGLAGIAAWMITLTWPAISTLFFVYVIAAWALVTGLFEILAALKLREYIAGEWLLVLSGASSLILGILMIAVPLAGTLAIALWVGAYAFVFGALLLAIGFRLRKWIHRPTANPDFRSVDWQRS